MNLWVHPFFCLGLGGLWDDQALGVLGVYPLLRVLLIRVPPLRPSLSRSFRFGSLDYPVR